MTVIFELFNRISILEFIQKLFLDSSFGCYRWQSLSDRDNFPFWFAEQDRVNPWAPCHIVQPLLPVFCSEKDRSKGLIAKNAFLSTFSLLKPFNSDHSSLTSFFFNNNKYLTCIAIVSFCSKLSKFRSAINYFKVWKFVSLHKIIFQMGLLALLRSFRAKETKEGLNYDFIL